MNETEKAAASFENWLSATKRKRKLKNDDELAKLFGVTRMTLYSWKKDPSKIPKLKLAGLVYLANDVAQWELKELCIKLGIID